MKVIPIETKPNQDAINLLEETLEKTRNGEFTAISISWVLKDNSIGGCVSKGKDNMLLWASLEHMARSFYTNIILK